MKFGIQHAVGDPRWTPAILAPDAVARFARAAEQVGFDAIAFTDHPAPSAAWVDNGGEGVADPIAGLAFCAALTTTMRLLTFVLVPAYRNPFLAAHQLATVDVLSGGRLTVALGTGYLFGEFRALGADPGSRLAAFDEGVELMLAAWSGADVSHERGPIVAKRTRVLPLPSQHPHPPLWIHGNSTFGVERAGRYGDGWLGMMTHDNEAMVRTTRTRPLPDVATVARRVDEVRTAAVAAGRDPAAVEIVVTGVWPMLDVRAGRSADAYLADVDALEAVGVDWIVSLCCGDDVAAAQDTVARFGEDVITASR